MLAELTSLMTSDSTFIKKGKSTEFKNIEVAEGWQEEFPVIKGLTAPSSFPWKHEKQSAKQM